MPNRDDHIDNLDECSTWSICASWPPSPGHGSVTEAARELHYSQPSVSHHLSRLEAATGAQLVQRVGRGIRLTPEGRLLAHRAAEIVGRVDAAATELAAQVGLQAGRVRLAANASVLSSIVPEAAAVLAVAYPGIELSLLDRHPVESLELLRHGEIDVALVFRYADAPAEDDAFRLAARRRRLDLPPQPAARRQPRQPSRLRLDRRVRSLPGRAARRVRSRRIHPTHRLAQRRDRRRAGPGRRRRRGRHHPRSGAAGPPPSRHPRRPSSPASAGASTPRRTATHPTHRPSPPSSTPSPRPSPRSADDLVGLSCHVAPAPRAVAP